MSAKADEKRGKFRNTDFVIRHSRPNFDAAYEAGVMGISGRSTTRRSFQKPETGEVVDFVRCSYLGLDNHPDVIAGAHAAIDTYRSLHWSCARTRLNFGLLEDLEDKLSALFGARVIAFSSVMVANLGALPLIASGHLTDGIKPTVAFDKHSHASLAYHKPVVADETRVATVPHNDIGALEALCRSEPAVAYIADGVYSMGGSTPIAELRRLQELYGLFLYIDDAHGISIYGEHGEGFARSQMPRELGPSTIVAASLGKGFGASGGILMLGTQEQEDLFRRYALPYAFSAAPNLAAVGAALASAKLHTTPELRRRQEALMERLSIFDESLPTPQQGERLPIRFFPVGSEEKSIAVCRNVLDMGYYTSATFFPTVQRGHAGIRICLTSDHDPSDIRQLCALLKQCTLDEPAGLTAA